MCNTKTIEVIVKDSKNKARKLLIEGKTNEYNMLVTKITNDKNAIYRACYDPKSGISSCYSVNSSTGLVEECQGHHNHKHCYHTDALKLHYKSFVEAIVIAPDCVYTIDEAIEDAIVAIEKIQIEKIQSVATTNAAVEKFYNSVGDPRTTTSPEYCELCGFLCKGHFCRKCTLG